jgi:hypothetical protein
MSVILATRKTEFRRTAVQKPAQAKFAKPYLENTQHTKKRPGRVARVVENLLSKHQALSSNPSTTEKKKFLKAV